MPVPPIRDYKLFAADPYVAKIWDDGWPESLVKIFGGDPVEIFGMLHTELQAVKPELREAYIGGDLGLWITKQYRWTVASRKREHIWTEAMWKRAAERANAKDGGTGHGAEAAERGLKQWERPSGEPTSIKEELAKWLKDKENGKPSPK